MKSILAYRNYIILGSVFLILVIGGVLFFSYKEKENETFFEVEESFSLEEEKVETVPSLLQVDIKGAVNYPGIYALEEGSRIIDAINEAGGMMDNADSSILNLSKRIEDEMVIVVYTKEEVSSFNQVKEMENEKKEICLETPNIVNGACENPSLVSDYRNKVSLNQASLEELLSLSGIGESKAKSILSYREEKGGFQSVEEIMEVKGIGEALFAKIKEDITL